MGCRGGLMDNAYKYLEGKGFMETKNYGDHQYHGHRNKCEGGKPEWYVDKATVKDYSKWHGKSADENVMKAGLFHNGPLAVAINAEKLMYYKGGVVTADHCNPAALDHAVFVVGYGTTNGVDYWLVKNSWGA